MGSKRGVECVHTIAGPLTGSIDGIEERITRNVARDAVRMGRGDERPWIVDSAGKPTRPLRRYVEYLTSESIDVHDGLSRPQREQGEAFRDLVDQCAYLLERTETAPRERDAIDPVAAIVARREIKRLAARLVRLLTDAEHVAKDIEAL